MFLCKNSACTITDAEQLVIQIIIIIIIIIFIHEILIIFQKQKNRKDTAYS